jgi:hypothetical protein
MAVVAGRHHDPSEGAELDLLRIVHVACRLADVLGYDVVKPLAPSSVDEVLAELPLRARERLMLAPEQLLQRIEERLSEFSSEKSEIQPEQALALLSSATDRYLPNAFAMRDSGSLNPEPAQTRTRPTWTPAVVAMTGLGLAAAAALVYRLLR